MKSSFGTLILLLVYNSYDINSKLNPIVSYIAIPTLFPGLLSYNSYKTNSSFGVNHTSISNTSFGISLYAFITSYVYLNNLLYNVVSAGNIIYPILFPSYIFIKSDKFLHATKNTISLLNTTQSTSNNVPYKNSSTSN